jgi:hypothetical protein
VTTPAELLKPFAAGGLTETLLGICRDAWRDGDKTAIVRHAEHMLIRYRLCRCPGHTCAGCMALLAIAGALEERTPPLTDEQHERAREAAHAQWMASMREQERIEARVLRSLELQAAKTSSGQRAA